MWGQSPVLFFGRPALCTPSTPHLSADACFLLYARLAQVPQLTFAILPEVLAASPASPRAHGGTCAPGPPP